MNNVIPSATRNISVMAHGGAGKSTLLDALLAITHEIKEIDQAAPRMLVEPEEIAHHVAIAPHFGHLSWDGKSVSIIDTPGYFNFMETTRGVLPGVDGAVLVISGVDGAHPETERLWAMLTEEKVPTIAFVNHCDLEESDFMAALSSMRERLAVEAHALTIPVRGGFGQVGVVDLLKNTAWTYKDGKSLPMDIPEAMRGDIATLRTELIERIVEADDTLLNRYLVGEVIPAAALEATLREIILRNEFVPVLAGSGKAVIGLEALLNAIVTYLPSPKDRDAARPFKAVGDRHEVRSCDPDGQFSAIVLKTTVDQFSGKLSVVRVVSGKIRANQAIHNTTQDSKQRTGHLYLMQGKELAEVEQLSAGQIGAVAKLSETHTGDTLAAADNPICFPQPVYPEPTVVFAVGAQDKGSEDKIAAGLSRLADEDPTLHLYRDEQTHEMLISGMGQAHIDIALERLTRKYGGRALLKTPRVPYRETIKTSVKVQGKLKKQTGGHGQFANCYLEVTPLPRNSGFIFEDGITGGVIPKQYIPSIRKGVQAALVKGAFAGYPVTDLKVRVYDGSFHDVDSSDMAFQIAGSLGFKAAMEEAGMQLLEPIMALDVIVPEESMGAVLKDLSSRRGRVNNVVPRGKEQEIEAEVPMAELLNYGNELSSITSGRGTFTMMVVHYRDVPQHIQDKFRNNLPHAEAIEATV